MQNNRQKLSFEANHFISNRKRTMQDITNTIEKISTYQKQNDGLKVRSKSLANKLNFTDKENKFVDKENNCVYARQSIRQGNRLSKQIVGTRANNSFLLKINKNQSQKLINNSQKQIKSFKNNQVYLNLFQINYSRYQKIQSINNPNQNCSENNQQFFKCLDKDIIQLISGQKHFAYLKKDMSIHYQQINSPIQSKSLQQKINKYFQINNIEVKQIYSTPFQTFFVDSDNNLYGIGLNDRGQLGVTPLSIINQPKFIDIPFIRSKTPFAKNSKLAEQDECIEKICGGPFHTVILTNHKNHKRVFYAGIKYKQKSLFSDEIIPTFSQIKITKQRIRAVECGLTSVIFLTQSDKIYIMGLFGQSNFFNNPTDIQFKTQSGIKQVVINEDSLFIVDKVGKLFKINLNKKLLTTLEIDLNIRRQKDKYLQNKQNKYLEFQKQRISKAKCNQRGNQHSMEYQNGYFVQEIIKFQENLIYIVSNSRNNQDGIQKKLKYCNLIQKSQNQNYLSPTKGDLALLNPKHVQKIIKIQNSTFILSKQTVDSLKKTSFQNCLPYYKLDKAKNNIHQNNNNIEVDINQLYQYKKRIRQLQKQNIQLKQIEKQHRKITNLNQDQSTNLKINKKPSFSNLHYDLKNDLKPRQFKPNLQIDFSQIKIISKIAQGGYGVIYKAQWKKIEVAVKIFKIDHDNSHAIKQFISQCQAMEALRHPNIVMFLGACIKKPNFAIVLQYCKEGTLWSLLQNHKINLSWKQRLNIALEISKAINYLHDRPNPIVHRDLKSLNVLLDTNRKVKIADFGWTKSLENYMTSKIGTYQWMAPEVLTGQVYTQKADIFSFGIILWEIASRQPPYRNIQGLQVAYDVANKGFRMQIPKQTPQVISGLINDCWNQQAQKRPSFIQIIERIQKELQNLK